MISFGEIMESSWYFFQIRFYNVIMEVRKESNSVSQLTSNFDYIEPAVVELGSVQDVVSFTSPGAHNDGVELTS